MRCHATAGTVLLCSLALSAPAFAQQSPDVLTPPANVLLPNYNSVPIGPNAGLEAGAYVARVGDPSAAWLNPAGLSRGESAQLSGSAGLYQLATVSPSALPDNGGSIHQLPSLVGVAVVKLFGGRWSLGLAVLTASSWAQQTDSQIVLPAQERFAYSADSEYEQLVGAGAIGYVSGRWRVGGGLALEHTSISRNEVVSDRVATPTGLDSALIASRVSGSAIQFRPLVGVQYDASPHVLLGAMVRTPAFTVHRTGSFTADATSSAGGASQGVSFFDSEADFTNRLPFEVHGGVAYIATRIRIEVDVHGYTAIGAYTMLSSSQPIVTYGELGTGTPPTIGTRPFTGFVSQSRGVVNASGGGNVVLTSSGVWRLHFGAEADASPVGPEDRVFTKVNLYGATVGLSGTKGKFQFSAGVNYRSGSSENLTLHELVTREAVESVVNIHTIGLIYALAYRF